MGKLGEKCGKMRGKLEGESGKSGSKMVGKKMGKWEIMGGTEGIFEGRMGRKWGENERRRWEIRVEMGKMENGGGWGEMGGIWGENENI